MEEIKQSFGSNRKIKVKLKKNSSTFNFEHCFLGIFQVYKKIKCNSSNWKYSSIRSYWIEKLIGNLNSMFDSMFFFLGIFKISPGVNAISRGFQG